MHSLALKLKGKPELQLKARSAYWIDSAATP
jgi:hypothetical protein